MIVEINVVLVKYEGIGILRDDHLKKEPMDPNISACRFVSVHTIIIICMHTIIRLLPPAGAAVRYHFCL